jgi:hypothetical protein
MAKDREGKLGETSRAKPHLVVAIVDIESDEVLDYRVSIGTDHTQHDKDKTYLKIVGKAPTFTAAKKLREAVMSWKVDVEAIRAEAPTLPQFDAELPAEPGLRAAVFMSLPLQDRQAIVYRTVTQSGANAKRVAKWLKVKPSDLEDIDTEIIEAGLAELELRIGKRLIDGLKSNNVQTASAVSMFMAKSLLGWNEQGPKTAEADQQGALDINLNVVQNTNPEVNELRNELDAMVAKADASAQRSS